MNKMVYVTTYTLDNGIMLRYQSHNDTPLQYILGENVSSRIYEGGTFKEVIGKVVEINKKIDILEEGVGVFAWYEMD